MPFSRLEAGFSLQKALSLFLHKVIFAFGVVTVSHGHILHAEGRLQRGTFSFSAPPALRSAVL